MKKLVLLVCAFICAASVAEAKPWRVDYDKSHLTFAGEQAGKPFTGEFGAYIAKIDMDPADPKNAKIDVTIQMKTAKTGDKQRDTALPGKDWFDVEISPEAVFTSADVKKIDETHFEAKGTLTIKHITQDVTLPFVLSKEGEAVRAKGDLVINRTTYSVGTGEWASEEWVAHKVTIGIDVLASQDKEKPAKP
jgi:polyisoprenoid-binding protein YceI